MKQLTCKMCGGSDLIKQDGVFVCQNCGMKYSVEEANKIMIEGVVKVQGTVKIDFSDQIEKLYELARRSKENNDTKDAEIYYSKILLNDPNSWEANFYHVYYRAINCTIAQMEVAANNVKNSLYSIFSLAKGLNDDRREEAINEIFERVISLAKLLVSTAVSHHEKTGESIRYELEPARDNRIFAAVEMLISLGDEGLNSFPQETYLVYEAYRVALDILELKILSGKKHAKLLSSCKTKLYSVSASYKERAYYQIINRIPKAKTKEEFEVICLELTEIGLGYLDSIKYYNQCRVYAGEIIQWSTSLAGYKYTYTVDVHSKELIIKMQDMGTLRYVQNLHISFASIISMYLGADRLYINHRGKNPGEVSSKTPSILGQEKEAKDFFDKAFAAIQKENPNIKNKKGGCYVATCVYGSYDCPQVWTLRRYRDDTLGSTWYGRAFIRTYYAISPTLVKWFGKTKWFKKMWKGKLDRMVKKLQDKGVEDTPYEDKKW